MIYSSCGDDPAFRFFKILHWQAQLLKADMAASAFFSSGKISWAELLAIIWVHCTLGVALNFSSLNSVKIVGYRFYSRNCIGP